jgi:hypothetical protein
MTSDTTIVEIEQRKTMQQFYSFMLFMLSLLVLFPPVLTINDLSNHHDFNGYKVLFMVSSSEMVDTGRLMLSIMVVGLYTAFITIVNREE